jgi:HEAT repeat protein
MENLTKLLVVTALLVPSVASAQATGTPEFTVYDRVRGEISVGTASPRREDLVSAITGNVAPSHLASLLEYGERVECHECVPLLQERMLDSNTDPVVRELAAWWLRRRPFGFGRVMFETRTVLAGDADPVRRSLAAAAIGEFMDWHGVAHLATALRTDADARVRVAAVHGLARINSPQGLPALIEALSDPDTSVIDAALRSVTRVTFFTDHAAVLPLLGHAEGSVRRRAATVIGTFQVGSAIAPLSAMLIGDTDPMVRQAAAWALGRLGTTEARTALTGAERTETSRRVLDAIEVALRM